MRLFCDHCGTEFSPKALRAESRFCSSCGKPLSEFVREEAFGRAFRSRGLLPSPEDPINDDPITVSGGSKRKDRESPDVDGVMPSPAQSTPNRMRKGRRISIPVSANGLKQSTRDTSTEDQNDTEETEVVI